ncbi:MAG: metallophosphoesterase [Prevotellaceae bacterium]|jgi:alkaline phosphatase|nr:metallophosphoesterase [Prevotellaceae bacterium]
MKRRTFIKISYGIAGLMATGNVLALPAAGRRKVIRFGVITDVHYADRDPIGTRRYRQSIDKLNDAMDVFNQSNLDFIIELGDLKDMKNFDKNESLAFLDKIEKVFQKFQGPKYHVLGNHDMDCISKSDFLQHTVNTGNANGKNCYSFVQKGVKFIVLDANYNADGSDYDQGKFDWTKAYVSEPQKTWLGKELDSKYPAVVFVHQLLDSFSGVEKELYVANAPEVVEILERRNNVLAVFQGHHHGGHYGFRNGIHYFTMKGAIEGPYPENNQFAVIEIDRSGQQFEQKLYHGKNSPHDMRTDIFGKQS